MIVALFVALALYVQHLRLRSFRAGLKQKFTADHEVSELAEHVPAELLGLAEPPNREALPRAVRFNVVSLLLSMILLRLLLLGLCTAGILTLFGAVTVSEQHTKALTGQQHVHVIAHAHIAGEEPVLTEELIRLSAVLGAFACLTFAVAPRAAGRSESDAEELLALAELENIERLVVVYTYYRRGALVIGAAREWVYSQGPHERLVATIRRRLAARWPRRPVGRERTGN